MRIILKWLDCVAYNYGWETGYVQGYDDSAAVISYRSTDGTHRYVVTCQCDNNKHAKKDWVKHGNE